MNSHITVTNFMRQAAQSDAELERAIDTFLASLGDDVVVERVQDEIIVTRKAPV